MHKYFLDFNTILTYQFQDILIIDRLYRELEQVWVKNKENALFLKIIRKTFGGIK